MHQHTFRHRVTQSMASLPLVAVIATAIWVVGDVQNPLVWGGWAVAGIMAYLMVEWNNQFQLLRVRSRMNSVTFISLMAAFPVLHTLSWSLLPAACLLAADFLLCHTYGRYQPQGYVFHAFLPIGIGSLAFPPLLFTVPFLLLSAQIHLRIVTRRSLTAALLGLVLPYWLAIACIAIAPDAVADLAQHWLSHIPQQLPDYLHVPISHWVAYGELGLLTFISMGHYVRTSFNDKIRTRQYFQLLLFQLLPIGAMLALYPDPFATVFPLAIVCATPFIAHYFALAKGRGMNLWFVAWLLFLVVLGIFNHFDLWSLFSNFSSTMA